MKTILATREHVLVTEEQASIIDQEWSAHDEVRAAEQLVRRNGLSVEEFHRLRAASPGRSNRDLVWGMFNQEAQRLMAAGDLGALKGRYYQMALFCAEEDREFIHLLEKSHELELREFERLGVVQKVRVLSAGPGNSCPTCLKLEGKVIALNEVLRTKPLPCHGCTTVVVGSRRGFCRCCYVAVVE